MSHEMDGVGLLRSGGENHHHPHENNSSRSSSLSTSTSVVEEDVGENSNASSEGTGVGHNPLPIVNAKDCQRSSVVSERARNTTSSSSNNNGRINRNHSRANYCQFETPADESRGMFPDDLDEELFLNMAASRDGQDDHESGEGDEEEEEEGHHHSHSSLSLDTADHSESSDIEEMYGREREFVLRHVESTPTSSRTNGRLGLPVRDLTRDQEEILPPTSSSTTPQQEEEEEEKVELEVDTNSQHYPNPDPEQIDLNKKMDCRDKYEEDEKCITRPLVDHKKTNNYHEEEDDPEEEDCMDDSEPSTSFPTSIRKRKCLEEETPPAKKPVTENDNKYSSSGLLSLNVSICSSISENGDQEDDLSSPNRSVEISPVLADWLNVFASWNPVERLNAINQLIQASEPSEVRHMMRVIEPQFQRDFISLLPKELALYVLSFLEPKDLLQAAQTCRYWRILCDDSLLWKEKCREAGIGPFSAMAQRVHGRRGRGVSLGTTLGTSGVCPGASDGSGSSCITSCEPWKVAYLRQHNVEMNWRYKTIRPAKTLKGHDDHVITCLQFSGNRIVSGSDDNTLKVWSATTGKCLRTLVGHTGGVWSSQMSGSTIVSGSTDRTLRVWNADTGVCVHTLYGHTSTVRCMHLYDRKVVSGSRDATLRVWDVDSGECLHVLVGHLAAVRCVQYNGKLVVSGAYDFMVRIWDVEREECLHQLSGHTNRVYSLQFDGIHVVSGSLDTSIRVWDVKTGTCKHTLMGHQSLTSGMELRDNVLVSGNADSTVKIWDINTGQCLLTLSGGNKHLSAVTCLQLINKFVITSSDDGTVKLWDLATGEFIRNLVSLSSGGSGGVVWRIRASETKLVCAVGSRNGTEETKLLVLDFDVDNPNEAAAKEVCLQTDSPLKSSPCV